MTILWVREALREKPTWKVWNERYASKPEYFGLHKEGRDFFLSQILQLGNLPQLRVLEIGYGQGFLLSDIYNSLRAYYKNCSQVRSRLVGIDASEVAICQADQRNPDCYWIADDMQGFAKMKGRKRGFVHIYLRNS